MAADPEVVLLESPRPHVALVTLNRPRVLNALSRALLTDLIDALERLGSEPSTRCVVITGAGRAFCSGGDLDELRTADRATQDLYYSLYRTLFRTIRATRTPVIAALNGHTFAGGLELACMCDIRVASAEAILCVGDADHGLLPTGGLTWTLPRLVGAGRAKWLAFSNARVTGEAAATFGLVEEAVPAAEVVDRALGLAEQIARSPGAGIGLTRDAIDHAAESGLESAMAFEIDAEHRAMAHPAVAAALDAFFQRG